jgi:valyl-tRNA synthetase
MTGFADRTRYDPADAEPRILRAWLDSGIFHPSATGEGGDEPTYSIAIPPPNVTGALHMGHALNGSIQDVLIRHARQRGARTKWIFGTDHAGIATQAQVEKALRAEGSSRLELGREAFEHRVWEWRERYGSQIVSQFQRLGASCDYADERFTLDDDYAEAVARVFVELFQQGLIYRDHYLVNWDPGTRSAISDLEVSEREVADSLYHIDYPLASGGGAITVATVRPETMLADVAIAVHPDDERYRRLVGERAILPLVGRRLPIIADEHVKLDFGTGALKITPGHDPHDFEIGRRHGLAEPTVINSDGRMSDAAGQRFAGLTVSEARAAVVQALRDEGLLTRQEPYRHAVPFSERSGERIDPMVSLQWFMRMDELAAPAAAAVRDGRVRIAPDNERDRYLGWLEEIRPWCISRQLWWGHRLPVWYCRDCEETWVAVRAPERCGACDGELRRETDVLDTWFSSALWPFATLGWPHDTPQLRAFYPTDVLSTARDIIFLWVARMVMMGLRFTGQVPFRDVYVHSVILASDGRRMSKSLGTGVDPLELIERHGADAVRFGMLAMASGQDVKFSPEKIEQGQALANKLFNACRLVALHIDADAEAAPRPATVEDRWILSRLAAARRDLDARVADRDFSHAALGLYDFVYRELCDWYLEWIKPRLRAPDAALSATLGHLVRQTLVLAHPVLPFVTEEIWALLGERELLAGATRGEEAVGADDAGAEAHVGAAIEAVESLRGWRDGVEAPPSAWIPARLEAAGYEDTAAAVARLARLELITDGEDPVARVAVPGGTVAVLATDAIDLGAAQRRRAEQRDRLESEIVRAEGKLANRGFAAKAPAAVVQAEREKLAGLRGELERL